VLGAVVFVVFLAVLAPLLVWLISKAREMELRRNEAWSSFASSHRYEHFPAEGPWYRRSRTRVEGLRDGVRVILDTYVVSTGKSSTTFTRVLARRTSATTGKLRVSRRGWWTKVAQLFGMRYVPTGDGTFDEHFAVRANTDDLVRTLLGREARRHIAEFPKRFNLRSKNEEVKLTWHGVEGDPAVLETAFAIVAGMGSAKRPEFTQVSA
jgi:hypothetical protein